MASLSRFDLVSMRLFIAVVDAGSLTAGADRFGISLAATSKRIGDLEGQMQTPLLARSPRGVDVTPAGLTLYRHAVALVFNLEQMAMAVDEFRDGSRGHVRIAANTSAINGFLPLLLATFRCDQPRVSIELEELLSREVVDAVTRGAADIGIYPENTPAEQLTSVACDSDQLVLAVAHGHPLAPLRRLRFERALEHDFIVLSRNTAVRRLISAAAESHGRMLRMPIQVHSFDALCRMVGAGLGIGVLPSAAAAPHGESMRLTLLQLDEPWARRRLLLGVRDRERLSNPARALVELIERRAATVAASTSARALTELGAH